MKNKRPWKRSEKLLFATPLLLLFGAGALILWRIRAPKIIEVPGAQIFGARFSPDGKRILLKDNGKRLLVFDVATQSQICQLSNPVNLRYYSEPFWSPDGKRIVAGFNDGSKGKIKIKGPNGKPQLNQIEKIALWDARFGGLIYQVPYASPNQDSWAGVRFLGSDKLLGLYQPPGLLNAANGTRLQTFTSSFQSTERASFSRNRRFLALLGDKSKRFEVRDAHDNRVLWQPKIGYSLHFVWSTDNVIGISDGRTGNERSLLLWSGATRRPLPSPPGRELFDFAFHPTQPWVALAQAYFSDFNTLKVGHSQVIVWNYATNREVWRQKMTGRIFGLKWSPDGRWLVTHESGTYGMDAKLWILGAQGMVQYQGGKTDVYTTTWSPDSQSLAIAGGNRVEIMRVG